MLLLLYDDDDTHGEGSPLKKEGHGSALRAIFSVDGWRPASCHRAFSGAPSHDDDGAEKSRAREIGAARRSVHTRENTPLIYNAL